MLFPQGHGRSNQRFSSRERKKEKKDIKNTTACHRRSGNVIAGGCLLEPMHQRLRVSAIQSAESFLDPTRHQTLRCLQDNWRNNGGEAVCAMLCASGNKEMGSTQRIHDVELKLCRHTTARCLEQTNQTHRRDTRKEKKTKQT